VVCYKLYIPRFQRLQNLFIEIVNKKSHRSQQFLTNGCSFSKPAPASTNNYRFYGCCLTSLLNTWLKMFPLYSRPSSLIRWGCGGWGTNRVQSGTGSQVNIWSNFSAGNASQWQNRHRLVCRVLVSNSRYRSTSWRQNGICEDVNVYRLPATFSVRSANGCVAHHAANSLPTADAAHDDIPLMSTA